MGPEGDDAERVADRMADRVMSTSGPLRNIAGGYASTSTSTGHEAPDLVRDAVRSPGQPLGSGIRAFFEPRFGHDFSQVRVHTGDGARHSARAIGARAYTVGSHIVLGEGSPSPSRLMAHELAHVVVERRGHAVGAQPVVRRAPGPKPAIPAGSNFTAEEAALLGQARATLKPEGNAIVGVLIPEGGKPIFLQSGGGQGFSSHIEGKATTVMREQGITRAKLIVELEPCQICDRSTYPGPDVPRGGVTGTASGKQIPMQTSKINTALPRDSKLTVVGPESTGIYEGVGPKPTPKMPAIPAGSDPHPDPKPVRAAPTTTTAPAAPPTTKTAVPPAVEPVPPTTKTVLPPAVEPVPPPTVEPVPPPTAMPRVKPVSPLKGGLKAGGKAVGWALLFIGLDYLAVREMQKHLEQDIDQTRPHMLEWAQREKARTPDRPVYLRIHVRLDDYTRYIPLLGWMPERRLILAGVGIQDHPIDPPITEVEDHTLDFFHPGKTTQVQYTELLIP